LKTKF